MNYVTVADLQADLQAVWKSTLVHTWCTAVTEQLSNHARGITTKSRPMGKHTRGRGMNQFYSCMQRVPTSDVTRSSRFHWSVLPLSVMNVGWYHSAYVTVAIRQISCDILTRATPFGIRKKWTCWFFCRTLLVRIMPNDAESQLW